MIEIAGGTLENLVVATAHGKVTGEDYEKVLIPAIELKLKTHKKIRLLYRLDSDFTGFTAEAIWDDAKLGFGHLTAFEVVAVVTDVHWIVESVKFFSFFLKCPVKVFGNDQVAMAMDWVTTTPGWRTVGEV